MNVWLLVCMMFVTLVTFEYAILLAIRFGKGNKIIVKGRKCSQIDKISLRISVGLYVLTVGAYFYILDTHCK